MCDINSSIGYNLSVVVDSCNTKALVDCECYVFCYKGVTKSFSLRYCTSTHATSMKILLAVVNNIERNIQFIMTPLLIWKHNIVFADN